MLEIIDEIACTDSTKLKEQMLKQAAAGKYGDLLKRVYYLTYCKQVQFGIKKIPEFNPQSSDEEKTLEQGLDLLENVLATRQVTGNNAITLLQSYLNSLSKNDAEIICRVIKRDLECGASRTIGNKVWKKLIPEQPQMLAQPFSQKNIARIKFPAMAQLKADGARCFAEIRGPGIDDVKLLSRAGNEYLGLDKIKLDLLKNVSHLLPDHPDGILIDGEVIYSPQMNNANTDVMDFLMGDDEAGGPAEISQRSESNGIANKSLKGTILKSESDCMVFQVWDIVPLECYNGAKSDPYIDRYKLLVEIIKPGRISVIENTMVNSLEEAQLIYQKYVDQGLEGIILKNTFGLWEDKRSNNQVKFKVEINVDMEVIGYYEHSKNPAKIGGFTVASKCRRIQVNVGSGFTDTTERKIDDVWHPIPIEQRGPLDREALMLEGDDLLGKVVQLKCNGWIKAESRVGTVGLYLPIIECFRYDKTDANTFEDAFGIPFEDTGVI